MRCDFEDGNFIDITLCPLVEDADGHCQPLEVNIISNIGFAMGVNCNTARWVIDEIVSHIKTKPLNKP